ncbi:proprotein convertase P-domain-containing protein [Burkholderia cenocepacia]|nr:proprotein convertase P-domain-containing protein [Burkholderia cenocepacia]
MAPDAKILDIQAPGAAQQPAPRIINSSDGMQSPGFVPFAMDAFDADFDRASSAAMPLMVKAAGNNFLHGAGLSFDECAALTERSGVGCMPAGADVVSAMPTALSVAAVNAAGKRASYSSTGSVLWISGLGGELGHQREYVLNGGQLPPEATRFPDAYFGPAITTSDVMGCAKGVNRYGASSNALDFGPRSPIDSSCNYTAIANGTSSAAPTVSGVIALMLQVNSNLSWRDIKYILATTARKIDRDQGDVVWDGVVVDSGWVTNTSNRSFSNQLGFGLVDATAAVAAARRFVSLPALTRTQWHRYGGTPVAIPYRSDKSGFAAIEVSDDVKIESVQLRINTTHRNPRNLRIAVISPSGTRSIVMPALTGTKLLGEGFEIGLTATNAFLDEPSKGTWKLQVIDVLNPSSASSLISWEVLVIGHRSV